MDGQLPIPEWTPLILPDEILCEELSPTSPTPTDDGGGGVAGPGKLIFWQLNFTKIFRYCDFELLAFAK